MEKWHTLYLKQSVVLNTYENGGLNMLDFCTFNNTLKINWAKHFIKNPTSIWNFIPHYIFSKFGGFNFLLLCNYNAEKLPAKLSNFHKQALLAWALLYKHNFSPHKYFIWNNSDILYKNKSLFYQCWFEAGPCTWRPTDFPFEIRKPKSGIECFFCCFSLFFILKVEKLENSSFFVFSFFFKKRKTRIQLNFSFCPRVEKFINSLNIRFLHVGGN